MRLWHIKQSGYNIGQARSKLNAVKFLETILRLNRVYAEDCEWRTINGIVSVTSKANVIYTIEQAA